MNEILIYSDIGDDYFGESVSAISVKAQLDRMPAGDLSIRINSPGGSVFDGFAIYNLIKQYKGDVTVYVDGLAASAASVVAMAGDKIVMADNALMMIHDPWAMSMGTAEEMRQTAGLLDKIKDSIVGTYASKTGMDAEKIAQMMADETWMNATEAQSMGFATESIDGGQSVSNLAKPWIRNAPKPDQIPDNPQAQTAWRIALQKRRIDLL